MIRVKYANDTTTYPTGIPEGWQPCEGNPFAELDDAMANDLLAFAQDYVAAASYGVMTLGNLHVEPTVVTLPHPDSYYGSLGAVKVAIEDEAGVDPSSFDFVYYAVSHNQAAGDAWPAAQAIGGRVIMNGYWSGNTVVHELGHTLGHYLHQGYSGASDVLGHGTWHAGRHPFDCMGNAGWNSLGAHYIADTKTYFGWIPASDILALDVDAQQAGQPPLRYTISALEDPLAATPAPEGPFHAVRLEDLGGSDGWDEFMLEFRQGHISHPRLASNPRLHNGVVMNGRRVPGGNTDYLAIDFTPETLWYSSQPTPCGVTPAAVPDPYDDRADCALVIGQTFADPSRDLYVTPLRKLNADPEVIEIEINTGPFQFNVAPSTPAMSTASTVVAPKTLVVLTASSTDSNQDPLSYYWQFHDASGQPLTQTVKRSEPTIEHLWDDPGSYLVKCTVSDRKGGSSTGSISITVDATVTNTPPEILSLTADPPLVSSASGQVALEVSVTDTPVTWLATTWSLVSAPAGATPTIVITSASQADVSGLTVNGSYVFRAEVTDGEATRRADVLVAVEQASVHDWGLGKTTSLGSDPVLVPLGSPVVNGGGTFQLQLRGGTPNATAYLKFGSDAASIRDDNLNSQVYAATNIVRKAAVTLDANGEYTWDVPLTNPQFVGKSRTYQVVFADNDAPDGTGQGASSAVSIVFAEAQQP